MIVLGTITVKAVGEGWLTGYAKKQRIMMDQLTGADTDYQVYFKVSNKSTYETLYDLGVAALENNMLTYSGHDCIVPSVTSYPNPYCWDTYFIAEAALLYNSTLARETLDALLANQNANGMVPASPIVTADSDMRSQTPVIAEFALDYYFETENMTTLQNWYPLLEDYYSWYDTYGSPTGSIANLVGPFTGRRINNEYTAHFAVSSSGMDNMPIYDGTSGTITHIGNYYYLNATDVLLSSTVARFAKILSNMSAVLGYSTNVTYYDNEFTERKNAINQYMWDDTDGLYKSTFWNGTKINVNTVQTFAPLYAGVANTSQAASLISHLASSSEYNLTYGVPSVAYNDTKYYSAQPARHYSADTHYWRGPSWCYNTYLLYKGLVDYGFSEEASDVALKWILMVGNESNAALPFAEYYDSRTGDAMNINGANLSETAAVTMLLIEAEGLLNSSSATVLSFGVAHLPKSSLDQYDLALLLDTGLAGLMIILLVFNLVGAIIDVLLVILAGTANWIIDTYVRCGGCWLDVLGQPVE